MLNQFEDMIVGKIVEQLQNHGINVSADTIKKALADSPTIAVQIETILTTTPNTQDKIMQISTLLSDYGKTTATTQTTKT
jgi:hypothetical protein